MFTYAYKLKAVLWGVDFDSFMSRGLVLAFDCTFSTRLPLLLQLHL